MEAQPSGPKNGPDEANIASSPQYPTRLLLTRPHATGYRRYPRYGKTLIQTFRDAASLAREKVLPVAGTNCCNGADTPTCQIKFELLQPILPETAAATVEETCDRAESARGGFVPYSD